MQEQQLDKERIDREKQLAGSLAKLPKGFRFKEERGIDPEGPPTRIDIIGNRTNPQKIKLSRLFRKIDYIRLEQDPDSLLGKFAGEALVSRKHIYIQSRFGGIIQYDLQGHFVQYVCKNLTLYSNGISTGSSGNGPVKFEGTLKAYLFNDQLYYQYENRSTLKACLIVFDDRNDYKNLTVQMPDEKENKRSVRGKGMIILDMDGSRVSYSKPFPYFLGAGTVAFSQSKKVLEKPMDFIDVVSASGDTLCRFKDFDLIRNFAKTTYRGVDAGDIYYQNGTLHLRQAFNDTIYQLNLPNRLVPKYILDFGNLGIKSAFEGVDPDVGLQDKLVHESFLETDRYLFVTYTKDYDCPNTARNGTLKYSRVIYDKKIKELIPVYLDEEPCMPGKKLSWPSAPEINIENDLDDFPFLWPDRVTEKGEPYVRFTPKSLSEKFGDDSWLGFKGMDEKDYMIAIYK